MYTHTLSQKNILTYIYIRIVSSIEGTKWSPPTAIYLSTGVPTTLATLAIQQASQLKFPIKSPSNPMKSESNPIKSQEIPFNPMNCTLLFLVNSPPLNLRSHLDRRHCSWAVVWSGWWRWLSPNEQWLRDTPGWYQQHGCFITENPIYKWMTGWVIPSNNGLSLMVDDSFGL